MRALVPRIDTQILLCYTVVRSAMTMTDPARPVTDFDHYLENDQDDFLISGKTRIGSR